MVDAGLPEGDVGAAAPRFVGRYRLVRRIGAGGMGSVWEAEQDDPRRTVAVKLLERQNDAEALERFRFESEVLAQLAHPAVAQVYEAGVTRVREGDAVRTQPWFALELVVGARTLLEYAAEHRLDLAERLRLFLQVAGAVQHGHQKGVIHRDLKPGNLLVDADGHVKVIDFGIARFEGAQAPQRGLSTSTGQVLGTLRYMSPEQVAGEQGRVDVQSDVFALGLVLYELASGRPAYDLDSVSLTEAVERVSAARMPPLRHAARQLPVELEWIVMRACASERERRYPSVSALADDLERLLASQPVSAAPPDSAYRIRSFVRRHRIGVGAAAAVFVGLAAASGVLARGLRIERAQRLRAEGNARFLSEMLLEASPDRDGVSVRLIDVLDRAAPRVRERFADQPLLAADLHQALGSVYHNLSRLEPALEHARAALELREAALGPEDAATLDARFLLADCLRSARRLDEAEPRLRELLALYRTRPQERQRRLQVHAALVQALLERSALAEAERELGLALEGRAPEQLELRGAELLLAQQCLHLALLRQDLPAIESWAERFSAAPDDVGASLRDQLGNILLARGMGLMAQGRLDEAREALLSALEQVEPLCGPLAEPTIALRTNLANIALMAGDGAEALAWAEEAARAACEAFPPTHDLVLETEYARCGALWVAGERERAARELGLLFERSHAVRPRGQLGRAEWAGTLGRMHVSLGRPAEGAPLLEESVAGLAEHLGDAEPRTQTSLRWLVRALRESGDDAAAEAFAPRVRESAP